MALCFTFVSARQSEQDASLLLGVPTSDPCGGSWRHPGCCLIGKHIPHNPDRGSPLSRESGRLIDNVFGLGGKKRSALGPPDPTSTREPGPGPLVARRLLETPSTSSPSTPDPPTFIPTLACGSLPLEHSRNTKLDPPRSDLPRTGVYGSPTPRVASYV